MENTVPLSKFSSPSFDYRRDFLNNLVGSQAIGMVRINGGRGRSFKVMAVDRSRDNVDHLQGSGIKRTSAPLGLWDKFPTARTIQQMMETMDRIVEDPLAYNTNWSSQQPNNGGGYARGRTPWEIKEGESAYKMRFDMPGMTKQDVKLWVEDKMLVIKAEKKKENNEMIEDEEEQEWSPKSYGRYSCRIALPENVEFEKIKAEVKDGVLYVTLPKASNTTKVFDINVH